MKKFTHLLLSALFVLASQTASAALLTFDDVPGGSIQGEFGNMPSYQGFDFSSTLDWIDVASEASSFNYGAHSGDFALVNNESGIGTVIESSAVDFTFGGLWAKRWNTLPESGGDDSLFGTLSGYNNGELIWLIDTGLNGSYKEFAAQAGLIDELRLGFGNNFLVDDIVLTSVPVPAAVWLFGSGLIALVSVARRKTLTAI
jgi:hypothetical protein